MDTLPLPSPVHFNQIHGHAKTKCRSPEYISWRAMVNRCHNPNSPDYYLYGACGITVCGRWRSGFVDFLTDVGYRPTPKHCLERINSFGDYTPGNVRWATRIEQARNRRSNHVIEFRGERKTMAEWAELFNINLGTLWTRIQRKRMLNEEALTRPVLRKHPSGFHPNHGGR